MALIERIPKRLRPLIKTVYTLDGPEVSPPTPPATGESAIIGTWDQYGPELAALLTAAESGETPDWIENPNDYPNDWNPSPPNYTWDELQTFRANKAAAEGSGSWPQT